MYVRVGRTEANRGAMATSERAIMKEHRDKRSKQPKGKQGMDDDGDGDRRRKREYD